MSGRFRGMRCRRVVEEEMGPSPEEMQSGARGGWSGAGTESRGDE